MISKANRLKSILCLLVSLTFTGSIAQLNNVENSIFWEVSGNGLNESSYLFGTLHLLGSEYLDSLPNVNEKFYLSDASAGEIVIDSTVMIKMASAVLMKDSTLDQLLPPEIYERTNEWLRELSFYDLSMLNQMNPLTIQMLIINLLQANLYGKVDTPIDVYIQALSKETGKPVYGLETIEDQFAALYNISYKRQAEILIDFIQKKNLAKEDLIRLNQLYRNQDLASLEQITSDQYTETEISAMLDKRNEKWMRIIPQLIQQQSTFIAVGALHLAGENGLVNKLRKLGFSVTPIPLH